MDTTRVKAVKEVSTLKEVNNHLENGWVLLGVFQCAAIDSNSYGSFQVSDIVYVLGTDKSE